MSPSEQCKSAGLKSLAELSRISGESVQTLINWHKNKPKLFSVLIAGAIHKVQNGINEMKYTVYKTSFNKQSGSYRNKQTEVNCNQDRAAELFRLAKEQESTSPDASVQNYAYELCIIRDDGVAYLLYSDSSKG